jgi:hypothetical protein
LHCARNIWVDGSLSNAEWFEHVFRDIRARFPAYRIAVIMVLATEEVVRARAEKRAKGARGLN